MTNRHQVKADRLLSAMVHRWQYTVAGFVILAGVSLMAILSITLPRMDREFVRHEFERYCHYRIASMHNILETDLFELQCARSFYNSSEEVTHEEFVGFMAPLLKGHPSLSAVQWAPRVLESHREEFERKAAHDGFTGFRIGRFDANGRLIPVSAQEEYFPILYTAPAQDGAGMDLTSRADYIRAMHLARDSGDLAVSIHERQPGETSAGVPTLLFLPVYQTQAPMNNVEERREHLRGFLVGILQFQAAVEESLKSLPPAGIDFMLSDTTNPSRPISLYSYGPHLHFAESPASRTRIIESESAMSLSNTQKIGGRTWRLDCYASPEFIAARESWRHLILTAAVLLATIALAAYLVGLARQTTRMQRLVSDLAEANRRLEREIAERQVAEETLRTNERRLTLFADNVTDVIWAMDLSGRFIYVSPSVKQATGFTQEEWLGLPLAAMVTPASLAVVQERLQGFILAADTGQRVAHDTVELEVFRKDGATIWTEVTFNGMHDESGRMVAVQGVTHDITQRRQLEEDRKKAAAELQSLYDEAPCGYHSIDGDGVYLRINNTELSWLGYTRDEIVGKRTFADLLTPESLKVFEKNFPVFKERGWVRDLEFEMVRKDGTTMPVLLNAVAIRDASGKCLMSRATTFDITERKRIEDRQAQSQRRLKRVNQLQEELLVQGSLEAKFKKITETAVEILDLDFCRIWKVGPGDLCEKGCVHAAVEPPHACPHCERCLHLMASSGRYTHIDGGHSRVPLGCYKIGRIASGEYDRFLTNDVTHDPQVSNHEWARYLGLVSFAGYRLHDSNGGAIGVLAMFAKHSISEEDDAFMLNLAETTSKVILENEAMETIRRESAKLSAMISGMDEGVVFADADNVIVEVNDFFGRLVGRPKSEILGSRLDRIHAEGVFDRILPRLDEYRKTIGADPFVLQRPMGGMEVILRVQPIYRDDRYDGVLLNVINVSELVEARRQAEAANATKSAFLANMSHEIRTPMTAILGYTDLLMEPSIDACRRHGYLEVIRRNGEHLLRLINDILDLSKVEAGKLSVELRRWSIVSILGEVASLMRPRVEQRDVSLAVEYPGEMPETILTDGARLRQAVLNLVGNAVKFTERGSVRIVASFLPEWRNRRPAVKIEVIDTGIGIREEVLTQLYQPFFRGDAAVANTFGGTGLGLAISRHIANMLDGELTAESVWGRGSCFTLTVPAGDLQEVRMLRGPLDEQREPLHEERRETTAGLQDVRVLLAEDGQDNRELICAILKQAGAVVETAANGQLAIIKTEEKPFDVILMDMNMPVMDGYEATRLLRSRGYSGPILALTANAMTEDRERCQTAGCDEYLAKPIDRVQVIETIARHVGKPVPVDTATPFSEGSAGPCGPRETDAIASQFADDPLIAEILGPFVDNLAGQVEAMRRARTEGRCDEVQRLAHQLKGAGGGYGYPALSEACRVLEDAAKAKDPARGGVALDEIAVLVQAIQKGHPAPSAAGNTQS